MSLNIHIEDPGHLFRYKSEVTPVKKKSKGGYLRGAIEWKLPVSGNATDPDLRIVISTYPDEDLQDLYSSTNFSDRETAIKFHPTVLHVARKIKSRLQYDQIVIPNYSIFEQELLVSGGQVSIVNKTSKYDEGRSLPSTSKLFPVKILEDGKCRIDLGEEDSKLNVIVLKFNTDARSGNDNDQLTLKKMIEKRIKDSGDIEKLMECFSSKSKNVDNKHKMRIKVDMYNKATGEILASSISDTIINTESNRVGAFQIHDVTPRVSCSEGGRKIVMISEFTTSDFLPRFQLCDRTGRKIEEFEEEPLVHYLRQPETVNKVQNVVIFISPKQPYLLNILAKGYLVKLVAVRTSDNVESKPFDFNYVPHDSFVTSFNSTDPMPAPCTFCGDIDSPGNVTNGLAVMKGSSAPHKRKKTLSGSGPRNKRVLSSSGSSVLSLSPDSGAASMSPEDSHHHQNPEFSDFDLWLDPETVSKIEDITLDHGLDEISEDVLREYGLATADSPKWDIVPDGRSQSQGKSRKSCGVQMRNQIKSLLFSFALAVMMMTLIMLMVTPDLFDGDGWFLGLVIVSLASGAMIPYYIMK